MIPLAVRSQSGSVIAVVTIVSTLGLLPIPLMSVHTHVICEYPLSCCQLK